MRFVETPIPGAFVIEPERVVDDRGFFARVLDESEFVERGLSVPNAQWSVSFNALRATLRGLHFQEPPHQEVKVVRCTRGSIYDVILDPRTGRWFSVELTASNLKSLYVPVGVAHGYQTLEDATEVSYFISEPYRPASARGIRWNDPRFRLSWPLRDPVLSERDQAFPDWSG